MAILQEDKSITQGIIKEINVDALPLIIQNLQHEYQFPIKSFIRETFSNGIDSIREKNVAKAIIVNKEPIDNYYVSNTDSLTKDSSFNPSYYNINYLSNDDFVTIKYENKPNELFDIITVEDNGVGLGGDRLKGFFELGYSSKRLNKYTLGKYGIGAKAGLSTGMDYFILTTRYNGKETSFMIYTHNYTCIIPKEQANYTELWQVKKRKGEEIVEVDEPIYWKNTTNKNGVLIELNVRKHNKKKFIEGVTDQLLYFKDQLKFFIKEEWHDEFQQKDIKTEVLFETENCIVCTNTSYGVPHLVVNGVNYGKIYWEELDMENKYGNIGVKVEGSDIEVNQSRESVRWTDKTKQAILNKIIAVTEDVTKYLNTKLDIQDNLSWLIEASKVMVSAHSSYDKTGDILRALNGFIDKTQVTIKKPFPISSKDLPEEFKDCKLPKFLSPHADIFEILFNTFISFFIRPYATYDTFQVERTKLDSFYKVTGSLIVIGEDEDILTAKLATFIKETKNVTGFIYLRPRKAEEINLEKEKLFEFHRYIFNTVLKDSIVYLKDTTITEEFETKYQSFKNKKEWNEESTEEGNSKVTLSERERRKLEQKVFYKSFNFSYNPYKDKEERYGGWQYDESTYKDISESTSQIVYGFKEDREILYTLASLQQLFYNADIITLEDTIDVKLISKENEKYFLNHTYISNYLKIMEDTNSFKLGKILEEYNTSMEIKTIFNDMECGNILNNHRAAFPEFDTSDIEYISKVLRNHIPTLDNILSTPSTIVAIKDYLGKMQTLHQVINEGDEHTIRSKSKELFGVDEVLTVQAIDVNRIQKAKELYIELKPIFKLMESLHTSIPAEAYDLIIELRKALKNN